MKKRVNKFNSEILEFIKDAAHSIGEFVSTPYGQYRLHPVTSYYTALNRLERQNLVTKKKSGGVYRYQTTPEGKRLIHKPISKAKRSDGNSSFVIFDIPESMNNQRRIFRRYLQANGFTLLQKSVLVSPDVIPQELVDLIAELNIKNFVTVISGKIDRI